MNKQKHYKGERYIYLCMAYQLAKINNKEAEIGKDNGYKDGYLYERRFTIQEYNGRILLSETKSSKHFADFSRTFEIIEGDSRLTIKDYMNEDNENCGQIWTH